MITPELIKNQYKEIYATVIQKLKEYNLSEMNSLWKEKYQTIRDESWPDCDTMQEFKNLPDWIQEECKNMHGFTDLMWEQAVIDDVDFVINNHLSSDSKTYAKKILNNRQNIIVGKDVVDLACYTGPYSFAAIETGASSVVGAEIRDESLIIANLWKRFYQIPDEKLKFLKLDIHDYSAVTDVCRNKHTALIPGVMYHIHDHFQLLESVAVAGVENILIETAEADGIVDLNEPVVWWRTEPSFVPLSGWYNNRGTVLVGYPNLAWFKLAFDILGYQHISTELATISPSFNHSSEPVQIRSIHIFSLHKKIQTT